MMEGWTAWARIEKTSLRIEFDYQEISYFFDLEIPLYESIRIFITY